VVVSLHVPNQRTLDCAGGDPLDVMYVDRYRGSDSSDLTHEYTPDRWWLTCEAPHQHWNNFGGMDLGNASVQRCVPLVLREILGQLRHRAELALTCPTCDAVAEPYAQAHGFALEHQSIMCASVFPHVSPSFIPNALLGV